MKVLYVWDADYPWDVRVDKICRSLHRAGHDVHIAARNLRKKPTYENLGGVHVHRLRHWSSDRINYILSFPLFCSPVWGRFLRGIVRTQSIDLIIVRDLPMAIGAIWAARGAGIPAVLDMAEDYVAMVRDIWTVRKFQGVNLLVRNPYFAKLVERYTFRNVDEVLVVIEEAVEVVVRGGGSATMVTLVGNTPELQESDEATRAGDAQLADIMRTRYSMIYTGGIQLGRGLQVVFEAIPSIVERIPDFLFVVVGDGYASEQLKRQIVERGISDHVLWLGWRQHSELRQYIEACKVGVVPHYTSDHVNSTIPNKIFDYMAYGVPVLASDARPMRRLIEEEVCGDTFKSGDANSLVAALMGMRGREGELGDNGCRAIRRKYNWQNDERRLLSMVRRHDSCGLVPPDRELSVAPDKEVTP